MKSILLTLTCACVLFYVKAQNLNTLPKLELAPFANGFSYPIDLANAGAKDSRLFVAERLGKIWAIDENGNKISNEPFLDITDRVFTVFPKEYDERGLLGIAFHPNFPDSPYLYVSYTALDSNSHVSRFTVDPNNPNMALKNSELTMLIVIQPKAAAFVNHKAGCIKFGPDGYLYGTLGDGGSEGDPRNTSQDLSKLLGKIFRIDINKPDVQKNRNYSIPPTNPFLNMPNVKEEIWASGLRNPFRFSFDRLTGDLWLPDVGSDTWEEINFQNNGAKGGRNYGWSCYEGDHNFKFNNNCNYNGLPYTFPIVEYKHNDNPCNAITGGFVYRGTKYPNMYGMYIYNDYCTGKYSVVFKRNQTWLNIFLLDEDDLSYVSFGEDNKGELYAINQTTGEIEHVIDASQNAGKVTSPAMANLNLKLSPNPNQGEFTIELNAPVSEQYTIIVTDIAGSIILSENKIAIAGVNTWKISSPEFRKGVYLLHLQSSSASITQNVVVDK